MRKTYLRVAQTRGVCGAGNHDRKPRNVRYVCVKRGLVAAILLPVIAAAMVRAEKLQVPEAKQTVPGLYMNAEQAYATWKANPESVKIIDVRTPEEYIYVGHPAMAWNVPLKFIEHRWDNSRGKPVMRLNQELVARVKQIVGPTDTILVTCRSGNRSTPAVNLLAEAGLKNVYNVVDGFEGDKEKLETSPNFGKRTVNGWKNAGLPWTYKLDPKLMWLEDDGQSVSGKSRLVHPDK